LHQYEGVDFQCEAMVEVVLDLAVEREWVGCVEKVGRVVWV